MDWKIIIDRAMVLILTPFRLSARFYAHKALFTTSMTSLVQLWWKPKVEPVPERLEGAFSDFRTRESSESG